MRLPLLALALILALVLSGCGGDSAPSARERLATHAPNSIGDAVRGADGTWSVVGVQYEDRLNVRRAPGTSSSVVMRLGPMSSALTSPGDTRRVGDAVWRQVSRDGRRGWANGGYLTRLGRFSDVTHRFRTLGAAPTRRAVARAVVRRWAAGTEGELRWSIARRTSPALVVDVFGAADDSVDGARLRIVTRMGEAGFLVGSVSAAPMCARGLAGGACV